MDGGRRREGIKVARRLRVSWREGSRMMVERREEKGVPHGTRTQFPLTDSHCPFASL